MLKLGITGNIASGKTLVESFLREEGIPVIDSDEVTHDLLDNDEKIISQVYDLFKPLGVDVRNEKGNISRKKVAQIVFKDREKLKELENIIHPEVKKKINEFFDKNQDKKVTAAVAPLLFESHMENMFDRIVLVIADEKTRLKRLIEKRGMTKEDAQLRMNSQIPQEEKINKADFIIDNSGSADKTKTQIEEILCELELE